MRTSLTSIQLFILSPPLRSHPFPAAGDPLHFTWLRSGPEGQPDWPLPRQGILWLLNFSGEATLTWKDGSHRTVRPGSMCCLRPAAGKALASAARLPGSEHDCLVFYFSDAWLEENLRILRPNLPSDFRVVLLGPAPVIPVVSRPLEPYPPWEFYGCNCTASHRVRE